MARDKVPGKIRPRSWRRGASPSIVVASTGQALLEGVEWTPELAGSINELISNAIEEQDAVDQGMESALSFSDQPPPNWHRPDTEVQTG